MIRTLCDVRVVTCAALSVEVQSFAALFLVRDAVVTLDEPVTALAVRQEHRVRLSPAVII